MDLSYYRLLNRMGTCACHERMAISLSIDLNFFFVHIAFFIPCDNPTTTKLCIAIFFIMAHSETAPNGLGGSDKKKKKIKGTFTADNVATQDSIDKPKIEKKHKKKIQQDEMANDNEGAGKKEKKRKKKRDAAEALGPEVNDNGDGLLHSAVPKTKKRKKKGRDQLPEGEENGQTELEASSKKQKKHKKKQGINGDASQISDKLKDLAVDDSPNLLSATTHTQDDSSDFETAPIEPSDMPKGNIPYPIWMQQISEYVSIAPAGFRDPLEYATNNYLENRLHNFFREYNGVLLSYKNVTISQYAEGEDSDPEQDFNLWVAPDYAPTFCWLNYDAGLFVPKRGAFMEGVVILEDSEHIGIQCWNLFNAFISARRLPSTWHWSTEPLDEDYFEPEFLAGNTNMDDQGNTEEDATPEAIDDSSAKKADSGHDLGHWIDENKQPVRGRIIRFRISNFDAHSGPFNRTYLAIEGSLLSKAEEQKIDRDDGKIQHVDSRGRQLARWGRTTLGGKLPPAPLKGILKKRQ